MKFLRLYAGEDGESHVEELDVAYTPVEYAPPAPAIDLSEPVDAARYVMMRFPAGWDSGLHPSPRRQLFVVLSGEMEGAASDGSVVHLTPGDALLMEDTSGKGHTASAMGGQEARALLVHLK